MGHSPAVSEPVLKRESTMAWWAIAVVVLAAALSALGGAIALVNPAMLVSPHAQISDAVRVYAGYMAARNLALSAGLLALLLLRAWSALSVLLGFAGVVQLFDGAIDCYETRWIIVPGVLVLGVIYLVAALRIAPRSTEGRDA